ncbi:MAG: hypothetical protein COA75_07800 [Cellvibrionales bacterium]|nr:MAG: hypothetical protein COA75_07800 [Cellvibrionales bacterium]
MLEQLRDIHLPEAVPWWPPAPGWWIVAALLLALTIWLSRYLQARYRRQYFRGESQGLLKQVWLDYEQQSGNTANADRDFIENTLALLRRAGKTADAAISDDSSEHFDSMPGPALLAALDQHSVGTLSAAIDLKTITERLYRAESETLTPAQIQCFYAVAKSWLKSKNFKPSKQSGSDS